MKKLILLIFLVNCSGIELEVVESEQPKIDPVILNEEHCNNPKDYCNQNKPCLKMIEGFCREKK